jgi:hypothetical protein
MPVTLFEVMMIAWNLATSTIFCKWWAYGNWFMLIKTIFMIYELFTMIPLIFEIDVYLRHMKSFRFVSLTAALIHFYGYLFVVWVWLWELIWPPSFVKYDLVFVFQNLFIAFNLITDIVILPGDSIIIGKEFALHFIQALRMDEVMNDDDVSLGFTDIYNEVWYFLYFLNPFNWIKYFYTMFAGQFDPTDQVDNDEDTVGEDSIAAGLHYSPIGIFGDTTG